MSTHIVLDFLGVLLRRVYGDRIVGVLMLPPTHSAQKRGTSKAHLMDVVACFTNVVDYESVSLGMKQKKIAIQPTPPGEDLLAGPFGRIELGALTPLPGALSVAQLQHGLVSMEPQIILLRRERVAFPHWFQANMAHLVRNTDALGMALLNRIHQSTIPGGAGCVRVVVRPVKGWTVSIHFDSIANWLVAAEAFIAHQHAFRFASPGDVDPTGRWKGLPVPIDREDPESPFYFQGCIGGSIMGLALAQARISQSVAAVAHVGDAPLVGGHLTAVAFNETQRSFVPAVPQLVVSKCQDAITKYAALHTGFVSLVPEEYTTAAGGGAHPVRSLISDPKYPQYVDRNLTYHLDPHFTRVQQYCALHDLCRNSAAYKVTFINMGGPLLFAEIMSTQVRQSEDTAALLRTMEISGPQTGSTAGGSQGHKPTGGGPRGTTPRGRGRGGKGANK
jgi:hypothetical protein